MGNFSVRVSPAHAGIDLVGDWLSQVNGCLPRPRGDRPATPAEP